MFACPKLLLLRVVAKQGERLRWLGCATDTATAPARDSLSSMQGPG